MSKPIPGILYIHFYEDDRYQLWAFSIDEKVSSEVQEAWDTDDWMQGLYEEVEEEFGTLDAISSPCDDVHGIGIHTTEIPFSDATIVMNTFHKGISDYFEDATVVGEIKMLQEGNDGDDPDFATDADIHALYLEA